jgi:Glycosyl hydrolases family 25
MILKLLCVLALIAVSANHARAAKGIDVSQFVSVSAAQCYKNNGYDFAIVRCYQSLGRPDPNCPHSVANLWAAGFAHVDLYMFPDPGAGNPEGQVQSLSSFVNQYGIKFGQVWMDIEGSQYWSSSQSSNVAFFNGLVSEASKIWGHSRVGVYTSKSQWEPIMGSSTAGSSYPLWCMSIISVYLRYFRF